MDYINKYKDYLIFERKLSLNTILSYQNDLNSFYLFFNKDILTVKYDDMIKYLNSLNNLNARSLAHHITVLNSFYTFLIEEKIINYNPLENIKSPKLPQKLPNYLTEDEVNRLLDIKLDNIYSFRNKAMLEVLYATGLRVSELINLKFNDIDLNNDFIRVVGKGNKERIVPFLHVTARHKAGLSTGMRSKLRQGTILSQVINLNVAKLRQETISAASDQLE